MTARGDQNLQTCTLAVLVANEPGVLARVVGLFSARGYNIDSLTVAEIDRASRTSRITIVTTGEPHVVDQIEAQLDGIVSVKSVRDLTLDPAGVERELALVKVVADGSQRLEALRLGEIFRARVIDITPESVIFEITGDRPKIDAFLDVVAPLGMTEVSRTGVLSIERGGVLRQPLAPERRRGRQTPTKRGGGT